MICGRDQFRSKERFVLRKKDCVKKIGKSIKQIRLTFNRNALEYVSFQDELYFRAYEKYGKYCKDGQYCNPDESQECQYCRLKIKKRNE